MEKPKTALDRFKIEEERIRSDADADAKHYDRVIREQEQVRDAAKAQREKAAAVLAGMIADFEKIEADLEAEEARRIDAQGLTKAALNDGRIGAADYFAKGITDGEVVKRAHAAASEKLADLRSAIRAKGLKLLELEAEYLDAAYNVWFAAIAPASAFRERLAALLKSLEASLASPLGIGGDPGVKAQRDAKLRELRNAQGKRMDGDGWQDCDLAKLKRLRLNPTWPENALAPLEVIIIEAKATGRACRIMLDPRPGKGPVNVMWS